MKIIVLFSIFTIHNVNAFEYHDVDNVESIEDQAFYDSYKELREEQLSNNYDAAFVEKAITGDFDSKSINELPIEASVKPVESYYESASEVNAATEENVFQGNKKPFYDLAEAPELFRKFIKDYGKQYKDEDDYNKHYENFVNNLKEINKLNMEDNATFDINMFADLGEGESITG